MNPGESANIYVYTENAVIDKQKQKYYPTLCPRKCMLSVNYDVETSFSKEVVGNKEINLKAIERNELALSTSPQIIYNGTNYSVTHIQVYKPSLHTYNGVKADGEIIITHKTMNTNKKLLICVPITTVNCQRETNSTPTTSSTLDINLNNVVQKKPFYTYNIDNMNRIGNLNTNVIVFDKEFAVDVTNVGLTKSEFCNIPNTSYSNKDYKLNYNNVGPVPISENGVIYIDCQPVGQSDKQETIVNNSSINNNSSNNTSSGVKYLNNTVFIFLISLLCFLFILFVIWKVLGIFNGETRRNLAPQRGGVSSAKFLRSLKNKII